MTDGEKMDALLITKIICFYIVVAAGETLNGIARTVFLNKRFGAQKAKRISMLSALAICLVICYFYVPMLPVNTDNGLILLGISLSAFMLVFDVSMARFVVRAPWKTILDDFNIIKGNLLAAGMIVMAACPLLSSRIAHFV